MAGEALPGRGGGRPIPRVWRQRARRAAVTCAAAAATFDIATNPAVCGRAHARRQKGQQQAPEKTVEEERKAKHAADFQQLIEEVRIEAVEAGVTPDVVWDTLRRIDTPPVPEESPVQEANANQPERKLTAASYMEGVVSAERVEAGAGLRLEHGQLLSKIEAEYGVPAAVLVALWGVESSFGAMMGTFDVAQSLAELAHNAGGDEARSRYFRRELVELMHVLDAGHCKVGEVKGSWAGAMGQCQFMPTAYRKWAVDADGDGRADIWQSREDALSSMANFLRAHGWRREQPMGRTVKSLRSPPLDDALGLNAQPRPVRYWRTQHGVELAPGPPVTGGKGSRGLLGGGGGAPLPDGLRTRLLLPDGPGGPAFLAGSNFHTVMRYNPSVLFAMAVARLAERIEESAAELEARRKREAVASKERLV